MSLSDHARAARMLGAAFANRAEQMGDPTGILTCTAEAYADAAEQMEDAVREGAQRMSEEYRCTINHATLPGPKCPACHAPRK